MQDVMSRDSSVCISSVVFCVSHTIGSRQVPHAQIDGVENKVVRCTFKLVPSNGCDKGRDETGCVTARLYVGIKAVL